MNFSFKRILLSFTAVVLLISSVIGGIHPFIDQKKNYTTQNVSSTPTKKDSLLIKKTTVTKPKEVKKETSSSNYFKDFISFDANKKDKKEENNKSFSLFPLLKEGLKVILNQITK
jgi:hypothetical protein